MGLDHRPDRAGLVLVGYAGGVALNDKAVRDAENRRLIFKILLGLAASITFAVAMVPLYNVLCEITGFNGKTSGSAAELSKTLKVDESRWVRVEFTSSVMPGLPWQFAPTQSSMDVRPGKMEMATYTAKNITSQVSAGQAIPSISPGKAAQYFKKIECFCFQRQALKSGEVKEMPLTFYVSPDLPEDIKTITLSYAFFSAVKQ
jgi:cytochrome c oxidase assembly protein subunit 11